MRYDSIIIGGGVIGLMTAKELVESEMSVLIVDKGTIGNESSWAGGGILSPLSPWRMPQCVTNLAQWSQNHYRSLVKELINSTHINPELTNSGMLIINNDESDQCVLWAKSQSIKIESLSENSLIDFAPNLNKIYRSALFLPDIWQIRNPLLLEALKVYLLQHRANIIEHTLVNHLLFEKDKCSGIRLNNTDYLSDNIIIASGAWSGNLVKKEVCDIKISPIRGQMISFQCNKNLFSQIILKNELYLIPRKDGLVLSGSTLENAGFNKDITEAGLNTLKKFALDLIPKLSKCKTIRQWSGLRPLSESDIPLIGEIPNIRNLYVNTGHYRNGILLAPASARLLADIILNRTPVINPAPYSI